RPGSFGSPRRSWRHAHSDAPGGLSIRGHLRSAAPRCYNPVLALAVRPGSGGTSWPALRGAARGRAMASAGLAKEFALPTFPTLSTGLEAAEPPEARGLRRDAVRLLVSDLERDAVEHARFSDLARWLDAGDLLVVNSSGTMNAALNATGPEGEPFELHVSTRQPGGFWTVELRVPGGGASLPFRHARAGATLRLPAGGHATLLAPYPLVGSLESTSRLWMAALVVPDSVPIYLARFGFPIRYSYVKRPWPLSMYQTVFATETGSAEMPSAGHVGGREQWIRCESPRTRLSRSERGWISMARVRGLASDHWKGTIVVQERCGSCNLSGSCRLLLSRPHLRGSGAFLDHREI